MSASGPSISIVIPMLDEAGFIDACLDGFAAQDLGTDRLEVLVCDGGSSDGSLEYVRRRAEDEPWIRVLDNPRGTASAAFNVGSSAARGDVICLFSSHGIPGPRYCSASLSALGELGADGVGGRYLHVGLDAASNAIGLAMVSPFGMASPHRFAQSAAEVDTISHPAYRASSLRKVLPFDESLQRNADYELNWRMREAGMRLWFTPDVESIYRPRSGLRALGRQFWWYGRWKPRVMRRHPGSIRPRHLVAPAAVAIAVLSPLLALTRPGRAAVVTGAAAYASVAVSATRAAKPTCRNASLPVLAAAFPVMHGAWGAGFLVSLVEDTATRR